MGRKVVTVQRGRNTLVLTNRNTGEPVATIEIARSARGTRADLCIDAGADVDIVVNNADTARKS